MTPEILELLMRDPSCEMPVYWPNRPAWRDRAACRGEDPSMFVPRVEKDETVAEALAVCAGCDVRAECLTDALKDPSLMGVWNGTTTRLA